MIRFTHDRKVRYISTSMYVTQKDITSSFKIKNVQILDKCEDIIRTYRDRISELNLEFNNIHIDTIVSYLKQKRDKRGISFTEFYQEWMEKHTEIKSMRNYKTSLNAFSAFMGRENILCDKYGKNDESL